MRDLSEITVDDARNLGWPPPGDMAWDVGANTGMTLPLLTALYSHVIAFEPAAESFAHLNRDWAHKPGVTVVNAAAADHDGRIALSVRAAPILSGQLVAPGMHWDWGAESGLREVPCVTLDSTAERYGIPTFVKVDTEGSELTVLQGATRLLAARNTAWMVEFHSAVLHEACEQIFTDAGYQVETCRADRFEPGTTEWLDYGWLEAAPLAED